MEITGKGGRQNLKELRNSYKHSRWNNKILNMRLFGELSRKYRVCIPLNIIYEKDIRIY